MATIKALKDPRTPRWGGSLNDISLSMTKSSSVKARNASHSDLESPVSQLSTARDSTHGGIPTVENVGVRSKSSYSLGVQLESPISMVLRAKKSQAIEDSKLFSETELGKNIIDEGFFKDVLQSGFLGIWSHQITKCYLLMYYYSIGAQNLFYFRLDTMHYRQQYGSIYSFARKNLANRLYNLYLSKNAIMPVSFGQSVRRSLYQVVGQLESPSKTVFDDLSYFALYSMQNLFDGEGPEFVETESTLLQSKEFLIETKKKSFRESAIFQIMRNDLRGTKFLNTSQFQRAIERLIELVNLYSVKEHEDLERFCVFMESLGVVADKDELLRLRRAPTRDSSSPNRKHFKFDTAIMVAPSTMLTSQPVKAPQRPCGELQITINKADSNSLLVNDQMHHTFIPYNDEGQEFCEFCLENLIYDNSDESRSAYRCESCSYMCHKMCRSSIGISCERNTQALLGSDVNETTIPVKIKKVNERIITIQKEVEIEMKIRDGLDRIIKARFGSKTISSAHPEEMDSQIARSEQKIEVLKRELQKCKMQLAILGEMQNKQESAAPGPTSPLRPPGEDGEILKVTMVQRKTSTEMTKSFLIHKDTIVRSMISMALDKFVATGDADDWNVSYKTSDDLKDKDGKENKNSKSDQREEVPLRHTDILSQMNIDYARCVVFLKENTDPIRARHRQSVLQIENAAARKINEVLFEILETESNYVEDLQVIVKCFMKPMLNTDFRGNVDEIFCNVDEILELHIKYATLFEEKKVFANSPIFCRESLMVLKDLCEYFSMYITYCSNQHHARRKLGGLKEEVSFLKLLTQWEANPRLRKLRIDDYLVKPMHRLTRYPMLLKRLQERVAKTGEEATLLSHIISRIESMTQMVNDAVREKESSYRLGILSATMDFNNMEKFKLDNGLRELVSEKPFTYIRKNGQFSDVLVVVLTDMILLLKQRKEQLILVKPPIPFESLALIDQTDSKLGYQNSFQILHQRNDIYTFQARSHSDKIQWLYEAESIRLLFCELVYNTEMSFMKEWTANGPTPFSTHKRMSTTPSNGSLREHEDTLVRRTSSLADFKQLRGDKSRGDEGAQGLEIVEGSNLPPLLSRFWSQSGTIHGSSTSLQIALGDTPDGNDIDAILMSAASSQELHDNFGGGDIDDLLQDETRISNDAIERRESSLSLRRKKKPLLGILSDKSFLMRKSSSRSMPNLADILKGGEPSSKEQAEKDLEAFENKDSKDSLSKETKRGIQKLFFSVSGAKVGIE